MKKSAIKIALLATVAASLSMFGASGANQFGSSESGGTVTCGAGTTVPMVGRISTVNNSGGVGVEGCAPSGSGSSLPIRGRVGAHRSSTGTVQVYADGSDNNPSGGAAGWDRVHVSGTKVCVDRGDSGDYNNTAPGSGNSLAVCN